MSILRGGDRAPSPVDRHVGLQMRLRRKALGFTQERLADMTGVTFQQIQKYERAANRVSASMLWQIAEALKVPVSYFFEGLAASTAPDAAAGMHEILMAGDGMEIATAYARIADPRLRRRLLDLVRGLAETAPVGA